KRKLLGQGASLILQSKPSNHNNPSILHLEPLDHSTYYQPIGHLGIAKHPIHDNDAPCEHPKHDNDAPCEHPKHDNDDPCEHLKHDNDAPYEHPNLDLFLAKSES
ncbi:hypothetical protein Tco_1357380, partial [Tanacetum coccineum]